MLPLNPPSPGWLLTNDQVGRSVSVASRPASPEEGAFEWTSEGLGSYSIRPLAPSEDVHRGCRITINLKEEELEFLEVERLRSIITKSVHGAKPPHARG